MSTPKSPTPQAISALLRKAGFGRSIGGQRRHSEGYQVHLSESGTSVLVTWRPDSYFPSGASIRAHQFGALAAYEEVIKGAGWSVLSGRDGIVITAAQEIHHRDGDPRNLEMSNLELRDTEGSGR